MSTQHRAFKPLAPTQNVVVTTVPSYVSLNASIGTVQVRFVNVGTQLVFILPHDDGHPNGVTTTTGIPLPAGQTEIFTFPQGTFMYSVIASATGSTLYSTVGEGI